MTGYHRSESIASVSGLSPSVKEVTKIKPCFPHDGFPPHMNPKTGQGKHVKGHPSMRGRAGASALPPARGAESPMLPGPTSSVPSTAPATPVTPVAAPPHQHRLPRSKRKHTVVFKVLPGWMPLALTKRNSDFIYFFLHLVAFVNSLIIFIITIILFFFFLRLLSFHFF